MHKISNIKFKELDNLYPFALRRQVDERAKGCCEYCLIPEGATFAPHEIDHIIAKKLKPKI